METKTELQQLLSAQCKLLIRANKQIVTVAGNEEPWSAFNQILDNHLLSAPCSDPNTNKYIGFLEVRDLVSGIVSMTEENNAVGFRKDLIRNMFILSDKEKDQDKEHSDPNAGLVGAMASRHAFEACAPSDPISKAASLLCTRGCRRVPIVEEGKILDIISQSSLVAYLYQHKDSLPALMEHTPLQPIGTNDVVSVRATESAMTAFTLINRHQLHGIAVIDGMGKLVGNTSASDIRLMMRAGSPPTSFLRDLKGSVFDFLKRIRAEDDNISAIAITVPSSSTLGLAMGKLVASKKHRVFVVDADFRPVAVISLTDIIQEVCKLAA